VWDQVAAVAAHVRASGANVPFPVVEAAERHRLTPDTKYAIELQRLRAMTEPRKTWTRDSRDWKFRAYERRTVDLPLSGRTITAPEVDVRLVDAATGDEYSHRLGAWEIKEAYSVAVGILHGGKPKQPGKAGFEYIVVNRILSHYFDRVSPTQTVALCHWALQDFSPGNTLFSLVERFESASRSLPCATEIYDATRREAMDRDFERNCRDVVEQLRQHAEAYGSQGNASVELLFRWYAGYAGDLLLQQLEPARRFPLDTFLCANSDSLCETQRSDALEGLFREVHLPLLLWPDGGMSSINADENTLHAVTLNRCVLDLFAKIWASKSSTWSCPLYGGCNLPLKDDTDCRTYPWKKGRQQPTCPYGAAAQVLGFSPSQSLCMTPIVTP
jgi:hypothetical protein